MPDDEALSREVERQAEDEPVDEDTAREGLELELMEHDASDEGEDVGESLD